MLSLEFPPEVGLKFCFVFGSTESPLGAELMTEGNNPKMKSPAGFRRGKKVTLTLIFCMSLIYYA